MRIPVVLEETLDGLMMFSRWIVIGPMLALILYSPAEKILVNTTSSF
jgi:hypothetical protein